ncbi:cytochrome P450 [Phanerochaete sordida]|uniref:Cytochrome P450 n=1 Tax=Phanerochaete sordida TaxID=48140 RepID=A0A9P3GB98_9APHY|nr:cytochrome P450 [Phanerochaete sordida]
MGPLTLAVFSLAVAGLLLLTGYVVYLCIIYPLNNPIRQLPGPQSKWLVEWRHIVMTMDPRRSPHTAAEFVEKYGRNVYIRGPVPWDQRLFTLDPVTMNHVLQNTTIYEKPWSSRRLISGLIGRGMLSAEGQMHKRQRRIATPAFSLQAMRALIPLVFSRGTALQERWMDLIREGGAEEGKGTVINVCSWASRATFDVMGAAGFDYEFNALQNEDNELLRAYVDMFETAVSRQKGGMRAMLSMYIPIIDKILPNETTRFVAKCQKVIERVAGKLIQEKKRKISEAEEKGEVYQGKDLLSLMLKSNAAKDLPPDQRLSDADLLHNINTFMFAGTDTTSLALTWTLYVLALYPSIQDRLRAELLSVAPAADLHTLTNDEVQRLYAALAELPLLENVLRETLRLIPPVHSSIREATRDDVVPVSGPLKRTLKDGRVVEERVSQIAVPKGTFVHVPIEGFNLDKGLWGESAWKFDPDRWNDLPETIKALPGLYQHTLTFSAGPRACIGVRMSVIELKSFLFALVTKFRFAPDPASKIGKANVILTRPYVAGRQNEGSALPLLVTPYVPDES